MTGHDWRPAAPKGPLWGEWECARCLARVLTAAPPPPFRDPDCDLELVKRVMRS